MYIGIYEHIYIYTHTIVKKKQSVKIYELLFIIVTNFDET